MDIMTIGEYCVRPHGGSCERCKIACPAQAISFENESAVPSIDAQACTKCGVCMGVCDAFTSSTTTTLRLYEHLRRVAMRGEIVYLTCKENVFPDFQPAKNVTVLPCLACMPPELWALLLAQNAPLCIACDLKYCEDCPRAAGRGELLFTRAVEMAEAWSGGAVRFDREMPELEESTHTVARDQFGRREAFDSVKDDAIDIISGKRRLKNSDTLKDVYRKKERKRMQDMLNLTEGDVINEFAESGRTRQTMPPRRRMLLEALCAKPDMAGNIDLVVSTTNHETCVECLDCTKKCPTGARTISAENGSLSYDARYCIGCGICVDTCPTDSIDLVEANLADMLPQGPGVPAIEPTIA